MASAFTLSYLWQISVIPLMQYSKALIEIYRRSMVINLDSAPLLQTTDYPDLLKHRDPNICHFGIFTLMT
jgi:hypothetical protein